jgi:Ca2+-binding EF-hand superfamily protein
MIIDEPQKMMMLENLALMRDKHKLRRIVLSYMSSQQPILTSQEQQQVSIIFKQFDKDHDGRLGLDDVA